MLRRLAAAALLLGTALQGAGAASSEPVLVLRSGPEQVPLVELYTSEGCSSSPAGDRWLSRLSSDKGLWEDFVPVAFHVDYWDYLGWKDRFASGANSERQREYTRSWGGGRVYTPGFALAGKEWRGWRFSRKVPRPGAKTGVLKAEVLPGSELRVRFRPEPEVRRPFQAHAALLGSGLQTDVSAGENAGRRLRHDFTVLRTARAGLARDGRAYAGTLRLPRSCGEARRCAAAVWISSDGDPSPIQAAGGYLR